MARLMTLSDDEIETIRIHLSAIKEELCNHGRYGEAAYYEKLIEKFLSSNVIRCKKCKNYTAECGDERYALGYCPFLQSHLVMSEGFCAWAEKRGGEDDETDCDYERAVEQLEHDMLYEPTFDPDDGSM